MADEPTGNLDSATADAILELFVGRGVGGKTVLMVTHERDVTRFADQLVTLIDGRVAALEPVAPAPTAIPLRARRG